ncbi:MAG: DUF4115 domain-containing protein [Proteobacteria bacterium]|nr:DUF4115 domain-containing protein [Candidatus Enterousia scatequi]
MNETNENIIDIETTQNITAGEMLRNARTTGRRKREIQTVAKQLCIREEFLQALEDCNYTFIPELVYVLGFARNYAIELGLDPAEIIEKIKKEMGVVQQELSAAPGEVIPDVPKKREIKLSDIWAVVKGFVKKAIEYIKKHWLWFAVGFGAFVVLTILLVVFNGNSAAVKDTVVDAGTVVSGVASETSNEPKYTIPVRERFGSENRDKATIILQAIEDSYVAVEDSRGKVVFGRSLVAGDVYFVPNGKHKAKFGNAGGIDIWVNNTLAPKVGKSHTAKSGIVLSADSLLNKK